VARQRAAGLFLDTLPYNAHTTCTDALSVGLPVLTRMGTSFPSRVAGSILTTLELPELIAASEAEYEDKAVMLATQPATLHEIREKIARNKVSRPLFDSRLFARHLEDAYRLMMERHWAGLAPDHIDVPR
jgi:predicted O-linked N-acetylglucosamine transferase (SPINDLY family)